MYEIWKRGPNSLNRLRVFNSVEELDDVILQAFAVSTDELFLANEHVIITFRGQDLLTVSPPGARLFRSYLAEDRRDEKVGDEQIQERRDTEWNEDVAY